MKKDLLLAILATHNNILSEKQLHDICIDWGKHPDKTLAEMIQKKISLNKYKVLNELTNMAKGSNLLIQEKSLHCSEKESVLLIS